MTSLLQDCAGAILYSTERAVEVALEGMQCLGGNGYINGNLAHHILLFLSHSLPKIRLPYGPYHEGLPTVHSWCWEPRDKTHANWAGIQ